VIDNYVNLQYNKYVAKNRNYYKQEEKNMSDLSFEEFLEGFAEAIGESIGKDLEAAEKDEMETSREDDLSQQENAEEELGKIFAEIFNPADISRKLEEAQREEEKRNAALRATIVEVLEEIQRMMKRKACRISFNVDEIAELESKNPEFAEATKEGFSEEEIRKMIVSSADCIIENLDLKRFKNSYAIMLLRISGKLKGDFPKLTGENVYEYLKENGVTDQLREPEVKKGIIFAEAVETVVKARTISFNNAIRKTIAKFNSGGKIADMETDSEFFRIINKLINLYLENEGEIVNAILKRL